MGTEMILCSLAFLTSKDANSLHRGMTIWIALGLVLWAFVVPASWAEEEVDWKRHTIDRSSRGADGVRLADWDGDGRLDIATGWEEGGITRVYRNPGPAKVREPWPAVTVGESPNVEDAVWFDVDGDNRLDVVSSCEGQTQQHFVHWAPSDLSRWQDENAWRSEPFRFGFAPARSANERGQTPQKWMFALPLEVDGKNGIDLVVGSKGENASVGWLEAPRERRDLSAWRYHRWGNAGWIMSLRAVDMDGDGDQDVLFSDRREASSGVRWLENTSLSKSPSHRWSIRDVGVRGEEVLFLDVFVSAGRAGEIVAAVKGKGIARFTRANSGWLLRRINWPADCGCEKAVAIGDLNLDGTNDLVLTAESATGVRGVRWLSRYNDVWQSHPISGVEGIKYDRMELIDLDEDGDLDVLTCEERDNLGVIWFENPMRPGR